MLDFSLENSLTCLLAKESISFYIKSLSEPTPQNPFSSILDLTPSASARRFRRRWMRLRTFRKIPSSRNSVHHRKELIYRAVARRIPVYDVCC